jgi:hypothetical protein
MSEVIGKAVPAAKEAESEGKNVMECTETGLKA